MFGKRAVQVRFVRSDPSSLEDAPNVDVDRIGEVVGEQIANAALVVVGSVVAIKVVDTLCKIAINVTNPLSWR